MIAIDVEFLTGRYVATRYNDRTQAEWPPHPARLYSALVAAWAEEGLGSEMEAAALDWLAEVGAPDIYADGPDAAGQRAVPHVYVPGVGPRLLSRTYAAFEAADEAAAEYARARAAGNGGESGSLKARERIAKKAQAKALAAFAREMRPVAEPTDATIESAVGLLPTSRGKQPRTFPSVTPRHSCVTFVWPTAGATPELRAALESVLQRVVRLGHSSSLVVCRLRGGAPDVRDDRRHWVPVDHGDKRLRTVATGQRARLQAVHASRRAAEPRVLPYESQPYEIRREDAGTDAAVGFLGRDWIVFREVAPGDGRRVGLPLTRAPDLARALRGALMRYADQPPGSVISGHWPDGRPLDRPHLAYISLADVVTRWASGLILGVALVIPRSVSPDDRRAVLRAVGRWETAEEGRPLTLHLGRPGPVRIERVVDLDPRTTLEPWTWCRPARHWASVTPVALDENPGDLASRDPAATAQAAEAARKIVARSCERIGLPPPAAVEVMRRSILNGCPEARGFMPFPRRVGAIRRVCVHAELIFDVPVLGPLLLGAGRYQGLGLFRPVASGKAEDKP